MNAGTFGNVVLRLIVVAAVGCGTAMLAPHLAGKQESPRMAPAPVAPEPSAELPADALPREITFDRLRLSQSLREGTQKFCAEEVHDAIGTLGGRRVRLSGYMQPGHAEEVSHFLLVTENHLQRCPFTPLGPLDERLLVTMAEGKKARLVTHEVTVTGRLRIKPRHDADGKLLIVYELVEASMAPAPVSK